MFSGLLQRLKRPGLPGPVVVGGVGGSGTRVLAQMLQELDFYIGDCLNASLDNLWYTLLLRRVELFPGGDAAVAHEIDKAIRLFETAMVRGLNGRPGHDQRALLRRALEQSLDVSRDRPRKANRTIRASTAPDPDRYRGWGWKEPNSHIHLESLAHAFPDMKFVLLMRNGLDMAFSRNRVQLERWGSHFGVPYPANERDVPPAALRYWVRANRRAVELASRLLGSRFLLLNFDGLCRNPEPELDRFYGFLGVEVDEALRSRLIEMPQPPASTDRYRNEDCSGFDPEDVQAVRDWGFTVDL